MTSKQSHSNYVSGTAPAHLQPKLEAIEKLIFSSNSPFNPCIMPQPPDDLDFSIPPQTGFVGTELWSESGELFPFENWDPVQAPFAGLPAARIDKFAAASSSDSGMIKSLLEKANPDLFTD